MSDPENDPKWVLSKANVVEQAQRDEQLLLKGGPPTPELLAALDRKLDAEEAIEAAAARVVPGYVSKRERIAAEYDAWVREQWLRENPYRGARRGREGEEGAVTRARKGNKSAADRPPT